MKIQTSLRNPSWALGDRRSFTSITSLLELISSPSNDWVNAECLQSSLPSPSLTRPQTGWMLSLNFKRGAAYQQPRPQPG